MKLRSFGFTFPILVFYIYRILMKWTSRSSFEIERRQWVDWRWYPAGGGGGVLNLSLCRECRPDLETLALFIIKSSWNTLFMIFRSNFTHRFLQNAWPLDPVYEKSSKVFEFETLFMSGRSKNHTLKGDTSPHSLCIEVPPGRWYNGQDRSG